MDEPTNDLSAKGINQHENKQPKNAQKPLEKMSLNNNEEKAIDETTEKKAVLPKQENQEDSSYIEETEEEVLKERRSPLFYGSLILLTVSLCLALFLVYLFYPMKEKVSGTWQSAVPALELVSKGKKWTVQQASFQGVEGIALVYEGTWEARGINRYTGNVAAVRVVVDKTVVPKTQWEVLAKGNTLYKMKSSTEKKLILEYTKKGREALGVEADTRWFFSYEFEKGIRKNQSSLYMNAPKLSEDRIAFVYQGT